MLSVLRTVVIMSAMNNIPSTLTMCLLPVTFDLITVPKAGHRVHCNVCMVILTQLLEQTNPYFLCCMFFNLCSLIPRPLNSLGMGLQSVLTVIHKGFMYKPHLRVRLLNWCADNISEQLKKAHFIYLPATKHIKLYLLWLYLLGDYETIGTMVGTMSTRAFSSHCYWQLHTRVF